MINGEETMKNSFVNLLCILVSFTALNAEAAKLPGNIALHIAKTHYLHPVRLTHAYIDHWHMKGPSAEKAAIATLDSQFSNVSECTTDSQADLVLLLEPHLFYNAQLGVFHAEYIARAYTNDGAPITRIKQQTRQLGDLNITPEITIEKAYAKAMRKIVRKLAKDQSFLNTLNKNNTIHAGEICRQLDYKPLEKLYY